MVNSINLAGKSTRQTHLRFESAVGWAEGCAWKVLQFSTHLFIFIHFYLDIYKERNWAYSQVFHLDLGRHKNKWNIFQLLHLSVQTWNGEKTCTVDSRPLLCTSKHFVECFCTVYIDISIYSGIPLAKWNPEIHFCILRKKRFKDYLSLYSWKWDGIMEPKFAKGHFICHA